MNLDREDFFFTPRYTRGQVCNTLNITKDALRYYEKCGLLNPKKEDENGYMYYSIADLEVLNVILFLRAMDVSVRDIPAFIQCKNMDRYDDFLSEQIQKAEAKIEYWENVKGILSYLKKTMEDCGRIPQKVEIVENAKFKFSLAKFDYRNYDIEQMVPDVASKHASTHIVRLKIVDEKWIESNGMDSSGKIIGHLCGDDEHGDKIHQCCIDKSLKINTLEPINNIPGVITNVYSEYSERYNLDKKVFILEHSFFNIFNHEALLRNIYIPII